MEDVPNIIEFIYKGNTSTWNLGPTLEKIGPKILKLFLAPMGETRLSHDNILKFSLGPFEVVEVKDAAGVAQMADETLVG